MKPTHYEIRQVNDDFPSMNQETCYAYTSLGGVTYHCTNEKVLMRFVRQMPTRTKTVVVEVIK